MISVTAMKGELLSDSTEIRRGAYGKVFLNWMLGRQTATGHPVDLSPCKSAAREAHGENHKKERGINRPS